MGSSLHPPTVGDSTRSVAPPLTQRSDVTRRYDVPGLVAQFATTLRAELDYIQDAHRIDTVTTVGRDGPEPEVNYSGSEHSDRGATVAGRRAMGELEGDVLALLWAADGPLTPGEVLTQLDAGIAYTTAMTILTRLWQKGLVTREPQGRAYAYQPAVTEAELAAQRMYATLAGTNDREGALSRFVGSLSKKDERTLRTIVEQLQPPR